LPLYPVLKFAGDVSSILAGLVGGDDEYFGTNDPGGVRRSG
jgi:hypothetical protein